MEKKNDLLPVASSVPVLTKSGQQDLCEKILQQVENGEINPLYAAAVVKGLIESLTNALKDSRMFDGVQKESEKFGKEKIICQGATFQICETGVKYDFDACGDPVYNELAKQKAELDEKLKERTAFLKTIKQPITLVDDNTGEVVSIYAPVKASTTSFKITFAK